MVGRVHVRSAVFCFGLRVENDTDIPPLYD